MSVLGSGMNTVVSLRNGSGCSASWNIREQQCKRAEPESPSQSGFIPLQAAAPKQKTDRLALVQSAQLHSVARSENLRFSIVFP
jgi:hypothetical protein